jgi:hypothetical protein
MQTLLMLMRVAPLRAAVFASLLAVFGVVIIMVFVAVLFVIPFVVCV